MPNLNQVILSKNLAVFFQQYKQPNEIFPAGYDSDTYNKLLSILQNDRGFCMAENAIWMYGMQLQSQPKMPWLPTQEQNKIIVLEKDAKLPLTKDFEENVVLIQEQKHGKSFAAYWLNSAAIPEPEIVSRYIELEAIPENSIEILHQSGVKTLEERAKLLDLYPFRDDNDWFKATVELIANYDETQKLTNQQQNDIERFLQLLAYFQHYYEFEDIKWAAADADGTCMNYSENMTDSQSKSPKRRFTLHFPDITKEQLEQLLATPGLLPEKQMIVLAGGSNYKGGYHATGIFKENKETYFYFDPNSNEGAKIAKTLPDLAELVCQGFECTLGNKERNKLEPKKFSINISVFSYSKQEYEPPQEQAVLDYITKISPDIALITAMHIFKSDKTVISKIIAAGANPNIFDNTYLCQKSVLTTALALDQTNPDNQDILAEMLASDKLGKGMQAKNLGFMLKLLSQQNQLEFIQKCDIDLKMLVPRIADFVIEAIRECKSVQNKLAFIEKIKESINNIDDLIFLFEGSSWQSQLMLMHSIIMGHIKKLANNAGDLIKLIECLPQEQCKSKLIQWLIADDAYVAAMIKEARGLNALLRYLPPQSRSEIIQKLMANNEHVESITKNARDLSFVLRYLPQQSQLELIKQLGGSDYVKTLVKNVPNLHELIYILSDQDQLMLMNLIGMEHIKQLVNNAGDFINLLSYFGESSQLEFIQNCDINLKMLAPSHTADFVIEALDECKSEQNKLAFIEKIKKLVNNIDDLVFLFKGSSSGQSELMQQVGIKHIGGLIKTAVDFVALFEYLPQKSQSAFMRELIKTAENFVELFACFSKELQSEIMHQVGIECIRGVIKNAKDLVKLLGVLLGRNKEALIQQVGIKCIEGLIKTTEEFVELSRCLPPKNQLEFIEGFGIERALSLVKTTKDFTTLFYCLPEQNRLAVINKLGDISYIKRIAVNVQDFSILLQELRPNDRLCIIEQLKAYNDYIKTLVTNIENFIGLAHGLLSQDRLKLMRLIGMEHIKQLVNNAGDFIDLLIILGEEQSQLEFIQNFDINLKMLAPRVADFIIEALGECRPGKNKSVFIEKIKKSINDIDDLVFLFKGSSESGQFIEEFGINYIRKLVNSASGLVKLHDSLSEQNQSVIIWKLVEDINYVKEIATNAKDLDLLLSCLPSEEKQLDLIEMLVNADNNYIKELIKNDEGKVNILCDKLPEAVQIKLKQQFSSNSSLKND